MCQVALEKSDPAFVRVDQVQIGSDFRHHQMIFDQAVTPLIPAVRERVLPTHSNAQWASVKTAGILPSFTFYNKQDNC